MGITKLQQDRDCLARATTQLLLQSKPRQLENVLTRPSLSSWQGDTKTCSKTAIRMESTK